MVERMASSSSRRASGGEGEHQAGDQVEAAAEVVEFADGGQRRQRGNGDACRFDLKRLQSGDLLGVKRLGAAHVDLQRQYL